MAIPDISTIKISQLNEASELQNNSALVANVAGETKKITFGNVMNQIKGEINPQISNLAADLNQEKQTRAAADATLQGNITNETNARTAADSDLNTAITNEATARASADTGLGDRIDAEATARADADTTLNTKITSLQTELSVKDGVKYIRGEISVDHATYDTILKKIQKVISDITTDGHDTKFDIVILSDRRYDFQGSVYSTKDYGSGILHNYQAFLVFWTRSNNNDTLYNISKNNA